MRFKLPVFMLSLISETVSYRVHGVPLVKESSLVIDIKLCVIGRIFNDVIYDLRYLLPKLLLYYIAIQSSVLLYVHSD